MGRRSLHLLGTLALAGMLAATAVLPAVEAPAAHAKTRVDGSAMREALKPLHDKMLDDHRAFVEAKKAGDKEGMAAAKAAVRADMQAMREKRREYLKAHPEAAVKASRTANPGKR